MQHINYLDKAQDRPYKAQAGDVFHVADCIIPSSPSFIFPFVNGVLLFPLGEAQRNLAGLTPRRAQSRPRGEHRPGKAPRPGQTEKRSAGLDLREARGDGGKRSAGGTRADTQAGEGPGGGSPAPPETPASSAWRRSLGGTDGVGGRRRGEGPRDERG